MNKRRTEFIDELRQLEIFTDDTFKKIYAESVCDSEFLCAAMCALKESGKDEAVCGYNRWFAKWNTSNNKMLNKVSHWYVGEIRKEVEAKQWKQEEPNRRWNKISAILGFA